MIVFLHGLFGSGRDWDLVSAQLPCPCIAFDLPGHGSSPIDFDLFAEMQKLPPFHLVGYSMGGRIARQYPGPVLSLTLISTHPGLKSEQECADRLKKDESLAQEILSTPIDEFLQRWYDQPLFKTLRSKLDICRLRKEQNREGLAAAIRIYSLGLDTGQKGAKNLIGEKDVAYRMHYKDIPHVLIPDAGHAIHLENPIQLAKEIYDHVLSVETSVEPVR